MKQDTASFHIDILLGCTVLLTVDCCLPRLLTILGGLRNPALKKTKKKQHLTFLM